MASIRIAVDRDDSQYNRRVKSVSISGPDVWLTRLRHVKVDDAVEFAASR